MGLANVLHSEQNPQNNLLAQNQFPDMLREHFFCPDICIANYRWWSLRLHQKQSPNLKKGNNMQWLTIMSPASHPMHWCPFPVHATSGYPYFLTTLKLWCVVYLMTWLSRVNIFMSTNLFFTIFHQKNKYCFHCFNVLHIFPKEPPAGIILSFYQAQLGSNAAYGIIFSLIFQLVQT